MSLAKNIIGLLLVTMSGFNSNAQENLYGTEWDLVSASLDGETENYEEDSVTFFFSSLDKGKLSIKYYFYYNFGMRKDKWIHPRWWSEGSKIYIKFDDPEDHSDFPGTMFIKTGTTTTFEYSASGSNFISLASTSDGIEWKFRNRNFDSDPTIVSNNGQDGIIFSDITLDKALELSADKNKPVFLFATMKGCGLCDHLVSKEFSNHELGEYYNNKFINIRVDYDTDQFKKVTAKYGEIKDFPTVMYLNTDGSILTTILGYVSYTEYLSIGKQIYGEEEILDTKIPVPSIKEFVSWSVLNDSELSQRTSEMEMKDKSTEECLKFTPNGEDEIFYSIEKCSNNSMTIDYGVKVKKGSSTYQKFTSNVAEFFNELKPHYSEKKSLMGQEVNYYRFVKNGTHYLVYVLDWPPIYCPETSVCGGKKIFLKWE